MSLLPAVDLALLSFLGVNGRAFAALNSNADPRKLLEASAARARKPMTEDEFNERVAHGETFRLQLEEFERRGGFIAGQGGSHELGSLMRAPRPPLCAYVRGDRNILCATTKVAIVGTREPSHKGVDRATEIAVRLSEAGVLVVSGGANGIDMAAHKGAVQAGQPTLAVLGDPLKPMGDERPQRLRALKPQELVTCVTLFGPWVKSSKALFVARNQFVAALADAVVIIEGRLNSGTLHTARYANQMGVPVWVIPGDPSDELSQAGNWLLEQGLARALVRLEYFLGALRPNERKGSFVSKQMPLIEQNQPVHRKLALSSAQERLIDMFKQNQGRLTVDELAEKCESPMSALQQELLMLELLGALKKQGTEFVLT